MLVDLTPDKKNLKRHFVNLKKAMPSYYKNVTFEKFYDGFTCVDGNTGFYIDNDGGSPKLFLKEFYKEYTTELSFDEEFRLFYKSKYKNINQYGIADNIEQIKDFYKEQIESDEPFAIFLQRIDYNPKNAGKEGGYRPYKSGIYIGKYEQINECEYYDDCIFDDDYQGYLIKFQILPVK